MKIDSLQQRNYLEQIKIERSCTGTNHTLNKSYMKMKATLKLTTRNVCFNDKMSLFLCSNTIRMARTSMNNIKLCLLSQTAYRNPMNMRNIYRKTENEKYSVDS